jgi:hypothetical protein
MASRGLEDMESSIAPSLLNQRLCSDLNLPDLNSNQRLCSVQLNEFNYLPWSRVVSLALGGRSRIEFIDKSNAAPDVKSPQYKSWFANDQMVWSWLFNIMEPHIAEIFSYSESVADLWDAVKEMYEN